MRRLLLCVPLLLSCEGAIVGAKPLGSAGAGGGDGTAGGDGAGGATQPLGATPSPFDCTTAAAGPELPLRRLSHTEYRNTVTAFVRAALPSSADAALTAMSDVLTQVPDDSLVRPAGEAHGGFTRLDQSAQQATVEAAYGVSVALGQQATSSAQRLRELMGTCATDADTGNDAACLGALVDRLGPLALRRPLSADDRAFFIETAGTTPVDPAAVADVLTVMTSSPGFLYQLESGAAALGADVYALDAYELAARLSYQYWQAPPDDALLAAAASGALLEADGYRAQVTRLLADARAQPMIDELFRQWFRLDELGSLTSRVGNPQYDAFAGANVPTATLRESMFQDVLTAVRWNVQHQGSLDALLTDARQFTTDPELAALYDAPVWDGTSEPTRLPEARAGLITRAAFLANDSANTRPVMKGVRLRNALLCDPIPTPPPNLMITTPELSPDSTTRQVVANLTEQPGTSCAGCHAALLNPLGYVTEGFDALGRARTHQQLFASDGTPTAAPAVDTTAVARVDLTDDHLYQGPGDVTARLAASKRVDSCFARQYFRFTFRRGEDASADACALRAMDDAARQGSLLDALAAPALLDSFKNRRITP